MSLMPASRPAACCALGRPRTTTVVRAEGAPWTMAPTRFAARAASIRGLLRMPVNARCTPLSERSTPGRRGAGGLTQRLDQLVGALVALAALADAAVDDLLQMIAAREPAHVEVRIRSSALAFHQHAEQLPDLVHVVARLPLGHHAVEDLARCRERIHRSGRGRRGDRSAARTMPKSPSFSRGPSQTNTLSGREVAMEQLAAVELAEHLEDPRDLGARPALGPAGARVSQEGAEIAVARVLQREAIAHLAIFLQQRKCVEDPDRSGMAIEQLPEIRLRAANRRCGC